jgi:hypothetical protein
MYAMRNELVTGRTGSRFQWGRRLHARATRKFVFDIDGSTNQTDCPRNPLGLAVPGPLKFVLRACPDAALPDEHFKYGVLLIAVNYNTSIKLYSQS